MTIKVTIDTAVAKRMIDAKVACAASIIGQQGGWSVVLTVGNVEKVLCAQRNDKPRLWKSLDRCVDYIRNELNIMRIDMLDSTDFSPSTTSMNKNRAAERMREAHRAAAYIKWLKTGMPRTVDDSPPSFLSNEIKRRLTAKRDAMRKRIASESA